MHIEQGLVLDVSGQLQVALTLGRVHLLDGAQLVQAAARPAALPAPSSTTSSTATNPCRSSVRVVLGFHIR